MDTGNQRDNPQRRKSDQPFENEKLISPPQFAGGATATVEPELYAHFSEWLERDLARLELLYKDWATAGYGSWRRSYEWNR